MNILNKHHSINKPIVLFSQISSQVTLEMAKLFVNSGFELICIDRNIFDLNELKNIQKPDDVITFLRHETGIELLLNQLEKENKVIDIFILNLEDPFQCPFCEFDSEKLNNFLQSNIKENLEILRFTIKQMKEINHGKILFHHHMGTKIEVPYESISLASTAFFTSILKSLREELKDYQITITELFQNPDLNNHFPISQKKISDEQFAEECFESLLSSKKYVFHSTLQARMENFFRHKVIDQTMQIFLN